MKKSKWHYQMLEFYDVDQPHNLCPYVRKVALWVLISIGLNLLVLLASFMVTSGTIFIVINILNGLGFLVETGGWERMAQAVATVFLGCATALLMLFLYFWCKENVSIPQPAGRRMAAVKQKVSQSLIVRYIKAAHDKVCPRLEFEDD